MDENSRGDDPMDIVDDSNDDDDDHPDEDGSNDDEGLRTITVRGITPRQFFGLLVQNLNPRRRSADRRRLARPRSSTNSTSSDDQAGSADRGRLARPPRSNTSSASSDDQAGGTSTANPEQFDTELPTEHSYLGNMTQVAGVGYLEAHKIYKMLIFVHHSMVFPGETLPMIIPDYLFDPTLFADEAVLFGVIFPRMWKATKPDLYGVTCQIYEKGDDQHHNVIIKCRVHQRFVITRRYNKNFSELLEPFQRKVYANVLIQPEIILPDPLNSLITGSVSRFRDIDSLSNKLRKFQASATIWPTFVYNQYRVDSIVERAKKFITSYKIDSMPTDMTFMSFWLCRNLIFDSAERIKVFITNSVNMRMKIIEKSLDQKRFFCCSRCKNQIADCRSLFAMSKHGVQTNYCNPSGFIHETNTVYSVKSDAVFHSGAPSAEFSWFPGYTWQILLCRLCHIHIGWEFRSVKPNLVPYNFFALSSVNVVVDVPEAAASDDGGESNTSDGDGGDDDDGNDNEFRWDEELSTDPMAGEN